MKIYFYPNKPCGHAINSILGHMSAVSVDSIDEADMCMWWKFTGNHEELPAILNDKIVINGKCKSTMKTFVEDKHIKAFGYGSFVDPLTYKGKAVEKWNENAKHACKIVDCPVKDRLWNRIYQRLLSEDCINYRVPVIFGKVPYYLKQQKNHLFNGIIHGGLIEQTVEDPKDLPLYEIEQFCKDYIDYCELDMLYDGDRWYIIDVNNTPSSATYDLMDEDIKNDCINKQAELLHDNINISNNYYKWKMSQDRSYANYNKTKDPKGVFSHNEHKQAIRLGEILPKHMTGLSCLDIGCGMLPKPVYMSNGIEWSGIDPNHDGCKKEFDFIVGKAEYLPYKDNSFDGVLFATSLDHCLDIRKAISEAIRVSRKYIILWQFVVAEITYNEWKESGNWFNKDHRWCFSNLAITEDYFKEVNLQEVCQLAVAENLYIFKK